MRIESLNTPLWGHHNIEYKMEIGGSISEPQMPGARVRLGYSGRMVTIMSVPVRAVSMIL